MEEELQEPTEDDDIRCHLQQIEMGGLVCRAARQTGDRTTNEVNPTMCFNCPAGKIFREVGCNTVSPKIRFYRRGRRIDPRLEALFCSIRKRNTILEYCRTCGLAAAPTTREIVTTARGLFEAHGFYSAYKDLERARESLRDGNPENAVTRSISCLESTMRTCHEKLGVPLPAKKNVTGLWRSTRSLLQLDEVDPTGSVLHLANALPGVVAHLGGLRNSLGDAHGKGVFPPDVSESIAELAINTAATLSTLVLRRFVQVRAGRDANE